MGDFRVHLVKFHQYQPSAIHGLAYDSKLNKLAVSRADGSIEIWSIIDDWYQEKIIPTSSKLPIDALIWCDGRLFSAGPSGDLLEHDLLTSEVKDSADSNSVAIWCLCCNEEQTQIAAGTEEGCVVLFDVTADGIEYARSFDRTEGRILSITWYDEGNAIITGGIDNIRIWSCKSGRPIQRMTLPREARDKETLVWTVAVTSTPDFTIISGDSSGKTTFWNGKQGTLLQKFRSHKADVLAVAVSKDGSSVYSSGIDPTLVQYRYTTTEPSSAWKNWVKSDSTHDFRQHTHDVRAIAITNDSVVSGGVDCQLIVNTLNRKEKMVAPIPHKPLAHTAVNAKMVLLQYTDYLELWRLGSTEKTSEKSGEILPLSSSPVKLLQLKYREDDRLVCCAISSDARWIVYSTSSRVRIYEIVMKETDEPPMTLEVKRIKNLPRQIKPAQCMHFMQCDPNKLVCLSPSGSVQTLKLDDIAGTSMQTLEPASCSDYGHHLLAVHNNGNLVATANHSGSVHVYSLKQQKHLCTLPCYDHQPTAISFHPSSSELLVAYSDQKVIEYNVKQQEYTHWSRQLNSNWKERASWLQKFRKWFKASDKIVSISYHPRQTHKIFCHSEKMFCIIDKTQRLPYFTDSKPKDSSSEKYAFHSCGKFKYLLHLSFLEDDFLVLVQRPALAITENLPPALVQKKFGT